VGRLDRQDEVVELLLPHSGVARFVEQVVESGELGGVCLARVSEGSPFAIGGKVPTFVALDIAAQAAAVLRSTAGSTSGGPPKSRGGYLVGARDLHFAAGSFEVGEPLIVTVERSGCNGPLLVAQTTVASGERELFGGTLSVYFNA
jgi:predicted hotdog family 3-hydroxylacyl-ACP dehydratase